MDLICLCLYCLNICVRYVCVCVCGCVFKCMDGCLFGFVQEFLLVGGQKFNLRVRSCVLRLRELNTLELILTTY